MKVFNTANRYDYQAVPISILTTYFWSSILTLFSIILFTSQVTHILYAFLTIDIPATRVYPKVSGLNHNETNNKNKHSLWSNTKGYGGKTH
jgi:hypothetical protein